MMRIGTIASRWLAASAFAAAAVLLAPGGGDAVPLASLFVVKAGSGTGRVVSGAPDTSIDCGKDCSATVGLGGTFGVRSITLLAIPDATATFTGWSIAGCGNPCTSTPASDTVTATFVDGRADIAVWRNGSLRPSEEGACYVVRSSDGVTETRGWGARGDVPVPADYDGDGRADLAVWRPGHPADPLEEQGVRYVIRSSDGAAAQQWGSSALADVPVPGDYDGDGRADLAVWRPRSGTWFILRSSGASLAIDFGAPGDVPAPRDWDGDGRTDLAVWRPSTGTWWVRRSSDSGVLAIQWGAPGDWPVPGDCTGDGRADPAVFRVGSAESH